MSEHRPIQVRLSLDQYVALKSTVSGELESFTEADWESGRPRDLEAADIALTAAWKRWMRRRKL